MELHQEKKLIFLLLCSVVDQHIYFLSWKFLMKLLKNNGFSEKDSFLLGLVEGVENK